MNGREGDAPLGDAFTARSHPIETLESHHRPDTDTTNTPDRLTLSSTQQRETCQTQPDRRRKKGALSKTQAQREQSSDLKNGREKKRIPTDRTSRDQLAEEAEKLGRCRASQSTDCFQQRCVARAVADAPMRGSALWQRRHYSKRLSARRHARATVKTALPTGSHAVALKKERTWT